MESIFDTINNNKGLIAIISLLFSFLIQFYKRFLFTSKQLSYYSKGIDKNEMKVILWNSGREVIQKSDFPMKGKLTIPLTDQNQKVKLINFTDKYSDLKIVKKENENIIEFDYLDPSEGISILISNLEDNYKFSVAGKIINGGKISRKNIKFWYNLNMISNLIFSILLMQGVALGLAYLTEIMNLEIDHGGKHTWVIVPLYLTIVLSLLYIAFTFKRRIRNIYLFAKEEIGFHGIP